MYAAKRRSETEMYVDLLRASINPTKPHHVMRAANVWAQSQKMLPHLIERGLLEKKEVLIRDRRTRFLYQTTEKGRELIILFNKINEILQL